MTDEQKKKLQEEYENKARKHYQHMCEAGFDPLLCSELVYNVLVTKPNPDPNSDPEDVRVISTQLHKSYDFLDRVITKESYVSLLSNGSVPADKFDDIIFLPANSVIPQSRAIVSATAAIFWLYPSGCKTLKDLYNKYKHKIKDELHNHIAT